MRNCQIKKKFGQSRKKNQARDAVVYGQSQNQNEKKEIETLKSDVNTMKNDLDEIKSLLKSIVHK